MSDKNLTRCERCWYWRDYEARVWARVSSITRYDNAYGLELRPCLWKAPPNLVTDLRGYTDANYSCSGWKLNEQPGVPKE